jgi:uncharacterized protein
VAIRLTPTVLAAAECRDLVAAFDDDARYRSIIDMRRHRLGSGTLNTSTIRCRGVVQDLRRPLYEPLAVMANEWAGRLSGAERYPARFDEFLNHCHRHGQTKPAPLVFRSTRDDFDALHQDVYGEVGFPLQALTVLRGPPRTSPTANSCSSRRCPEFSRSGR